MRRKRDKPLAVMHVDRLETYRGMAVHKEPLGGGPVGESEWTRPEVGQAEEHGWRR